jgi:DNA gyrase subunit A
VEAVYQEKKMEETEVVYLMDRFGYAKTVDVSVYERNKEAADAENKYVLTCMNTDKICLFTDTGKQHTIKVVDVPYGKFRDKGTPIDNLCNYDSTQEMIVYIQSLEKVKASRLLFTTSQGMMKRVDGKEFDVSKRTIAATKLGENDMVLSVACIDDIGQVVLRSKQGCFLRFPVEEVPEKKKGAVGVRGIRLAENDALEEIYYLGAENESDTILYKEKEVQLRKLRLGKRDAKGTKIRV